MNVQERLEMENKTEEFENKAGVIIDYGCNRILDLTPIDPNLKYVKRGYASINNKTTKSALSYVFMGTKKATSEADLKNYPVLLWLNGGPGSSSIANGAL